VLLAKVVVLPGAPVRTLVFGGGCFFLFTVLVGVVVAMVILASRGGRGSAASQRRLCPDCGHAVFPRAKFCTECGRRLGEEQTP
jgi:hypothetical protein